VDDSNQFHIEGRDNTRSTDEYKLRSAIALLISKPLNFTKEYCRYCFSKVRDDLIIEHTEKCVCVQGQTWLLIKRNTVGVYPAPSADMVKALVENYSIGYGLDEWESVSNCAYCEAYPEYDGGEGHENSCPILVVEEWLNDNAE